MEGRVDPPSSMMRLGIGQSEGQRRHKRDLFLIREAGRPVGCLFGTPTPAAYYIGKLAVAAPQRGRGLARALVEAAATRARALGAPALESLQSRVELVENHTALHRDGLHAGRGPPRIPAYDRPTSLTFRRAL